MAKDGKKLELFEILAAKRAKGKIPLGMDAKPAKQANTPDPDPEVMDGPGIIIDDAVSAEAGYQQQQKETVALPPRESKREPVRVEPAAPPKMERKQSRVEYRQQRVEPAAPRPAPAPAPAPPPEPEPVPEPRPKSPREVVIALDTALIVFVMIVALVGSSYFIGYKRGQEERPVGIAGVGDIETADPSRLNIRNLSPPPRAAMRPPEQDYTLIIRREPATDELPERLELELAEALARGIRESGREIPGFIFRTGGADPHYILAVGLGQTANDAELARLLKIYNEMEGINLSRQSRPYLGCRIAPIRELGTPVY